MTSPDRHRTTHPLRIALLVTLAACNPTPAGPAPADINDPAATLARLASEPEGPARKPLFIALRRAPAERALPVLESGLANLRHAAAFAPLQHNLSHETAIVRLAALRALARIDPLQAAALPELARLQLDADNRVAGAATKIARGIAPH
jgi:HEAT repeat protein